MLILITKIKTKRLIKNITIPKSCGTNVRLPLEKTVIKLDNAFPQDYQQRLKERFLEEHCKNLVNDKEYELLLLEMKRYLIMCSIVKNVPMFSEKVDDVWHEMLMFTQYYQDFSQDFCGTFIHHEPVREKKAEPNNRAFFDLMYSTLFTVTDYTQIAWGDFYQNKLDKELINELLNSSKDAIIEKYFRPNADRELLYAIIRELKYIIKLSLGSPSFNLRGINKDKMSENFSVYTKGMIHHSFNNDSSYSKHMAFNSSGKSSNSSSGCSSTSSCGSSCGSSCSSGCSSS